MKRKILLVLLLLPCFLARAQRTSISLDGTWHLAIDKADSGIKAGWFKRQFTQKIKLPGTLDDAEIGEPVKTDTSVLSKEIMLHLSRRVKFIGPVWYQKSFTLTSGMSNARLMLERVIWKTDCWIDGRPVGSRESLIAPQNFDLGQLNPGIHVVTLRIDNRKQHDISFNDFAHAYTDGTQIIWNGIIGRIVISDRSPVSFDRIAINSFPDAKRAVANIRLSFSRQERVYLRHRLSIDGKIIKVSSKRLLHTNLAEETEVILPDIKRWDEFHPNIYTWTFELIDKKGKILETRSENFGFRQLVSQHNQLRINGRPLFLRGTLECNIFPISGHPPMEQAGWLKVFNAAKSYGLNHLRFHSWCPPEAAFRVADSLGFYLHVELPLWSLDVGKDAETLRYLEMEAQEIINNYGNHPSFCFWSMGNELEGNFVWLENLVKKLKNEDNRHLYTTTTFSFQKGHGKSPEPQDDYFITQYTEKGWVRGQGIFNTNAPDFKTDYSKSLADVNVPLVIHEVGQYSVFPDLSEIARYTGVLAPANFQAVRNDMRKKGMLDLAVPYLRASGKLSANLYKEEIERALKTKGVGGFQLLDLHDFPGQGTALVGILNAFWESKGIISPEAFREFCGPVVPLLRFQKATYTNNENFRATVEVANYLDKTLNDELLWTITDKRHRVLVKGSLGIKQYAVGNGESAGEINIPLSACKEASELTVKLSLKNAGYTNQWKIWVYPQEPEVKENNVIFTTSVDTALNLLKDGKTVLLNPDTSAIKGIDGRFAPVFWSPVHFPDQPGSMGLLINQSHQSLAHFPTDDYSDWQWWDLVTRSRSISLEGLSTQPVAIVRVIDNFFRNRNLGVLMEYKSGNGKLLLCTMDIQHDLNNRPAARQLKRSLLHYAGSKDFNPTQVLNPQKLSSICK